MERRYRSNLLSRTYLLQATLFALFGHLPSSHGLSCYCSDEPSDRLPVCHWDGYMCTGDVCFIRRFLKDGVIYTKWGCMSHSNPSHHIDLVCDGAFNGDTEHYTCCTDRNSCNQNIQIVLPIERPTTTSAPLVATTVDRSSSGNGDGTEPSDPLSISSSSPAVTEMEGDHTTHSPAATTSGNGDGTEPSDPLSISSSSPAVTEMEGDHTTHSPAPTTVLQPSLVGNVASSLTAATSLPPMSRPTSTPSPNPTGLPQLKCYCSTCPSLEVTCGPGSSCYVHKDYNQGKGETAGVPFSLSWGCMNISESAKKCHGQSKEYKCCMHKDFCNMKLHRDGSTDCNSLSGGCQPSQLQGDNLIVTISVCVISFIITVIVLVAIAVLLLRIRQLHRRNSIRAKMSGSNSSSNSVTTESESLPSPTSTSSTHHYLHVSSLPDSEPAFGGSLKCSGK